MLTFRVFVPFSKFNVGERYASTIHTWRVYFYFQIVMFTTASQTDNALHSRFLSQHPFSVQKRTVDLIALSALDVILFRQSPGMTLTSKMSCLIDIVRSIPNFTPWVVYLTHHHRFIMSLRNDENDLALLQTVVSSETFHLCSITSL